MFTLFPYNDRHPEFEINIFNREHSFINKTQINHGDFLFFNSPFFYTVVTILTPDQVSLRIDRALNNSSSCRGKMIFFFFSRSSKSGLFLHNTVKTFSTLRLFAKCTIITPTSKFKLHLPKTCLLTKTIEREKKIKKKKII